MLQECMKFILAILFLMQSCTYHHYDYKNDRAHQKRIADAYLAHKQCRKKYPEHLSDLVNGGFLPECGDFYSNAIIFDWSLFGREIRYSDSDYRLRPATERNLKYKTVIEYTPSNRAGKTVTNAVPPCDVFEGDLD